MRHEDRHSGSQTYLMGVNEATLTHFESKTCLRKACS